MSKIRVYEYAKEKNVTSKEVITKLKELDIPVSNHMSTIDSEVIQKLEGKIGSATKEKAAPKQETNKPASKQETNKPAPKQQPSKQANVSKPANQAGQGNKQNNNHSKPAANNNRQGGQNSNNRPNNNNRPNHNNRNNNNKGPKNNKNQKNKQSQQQPVQQQPKKVEMPSKITYTGSLTVGELAKKIHKEPTEIIKKLFMLGTMATINQELDGDSIELIAGEYGVEVEEEIILETTDFAKYEMDEKEEDLQIRPAVVTIMGHVDHGKTTLLDSIRNTKVTAGEAGGITQHIGAYQIEEQGKKITFLDTPGHAAFTTMRARGAKVTDITILVVAADDGVMPQTIEAINHAKAAEVPIIVAVNKMDKEGANPDRVMQELTEHGLVSEEWGGDTIFTKLSAIKGEGIDELLEMILLVAEVEEYKANPNRLAAGTVIEAELDKGKGAVATLLVQNGTLKVGDPIVVGNAFGRVRAMINDLGRRVKVAPPSTPVEITGLNDVPNAGDQFLVFQDEKQARAVGEARATKQREADRGEKSKVSLDDLFNKIKEGDMKAINVIVKADVQGSAEAMAASLQKIDVEGVRINIIHTGVGAITESDIILASASNAIVIGFNVRPDVNAKRTAEAEDVDVRLHRIIYKAIEEIEAAMKGMLDPEFEEKVIGQVQVRETFKVSKIGTIAGCYVTEGKVTRDSSVRLIRDGIVVYEGEIDTLRRFKDDVKEVAQNYECGITLDKFNDIKEGDVIEAYIMEEIKRK